MSKGNDYGNNRIKNDDFITAEEIAHKVAGELRAEPDLKIFGVSGAGSVNSNKLTYAENEDFLQRALKNEAALILLQENIYSPEIPAVICHEPRLAYARAAEMFPDRRYLAPGIADNAFVDEQVSLGENISLHEGVVISGPVCIGDNTRIAPGCLVVGDVEIGENCLLHPGAKILPGTKIGSRVEIQAGAVIGSDGFGYATNRGENANSSDRNIKTEHFKIPQQGGVVIEDDVEVGALTAVDRAVEGFTRIGTGSKIDNLVQISHNVQIGPAALIAGQSGIAGSSSLGSDVILAGQVGVEDHVKIGDEITVTGKAKVSKDLKESGHYSGIPALPHRKYLHIEAKLRRVPELKEKVEKLSDEIASIREELEDENAAEEN